MDYLDNDMILQILKYPYTIPSMLTKYIHFNKEMQLAYIKDMIKNSNPSHPSHP
jgi:hypothetical protein